MSAQPPTMQTKEISNEDGVCAAQNPALQKKEKCQSLGMMLQE
ncbi:MAG: hypothetical protein ACRCVX_14130 [Shewanella sp.]